MSQLPEKTVERLSQYRRILLKACPKEKQHIYSHEIAQLLHLTPVQVRRDLMLIGYSGSQRKGYEINKLIHLIGEIIDSKEGQKVALIGVGNLGRAIIRYVNKKNSNLKIVAAFDTNPDKVNKEVSGINCYHYDQLAKIAKKEKITIGIICVPTEYCVSVADCLIKSGVKGILNFTAAPLNISDQVFLEEYDMITSLEKVAYFSKENK
ncbi:MAG: redox-sensing transcriptional repressor Rex [Bacteroidetes bacterium]|nr:redox-sensing transcriptional repressor Rex [Bacteroidota bacterium]